MIAIATSTNIIACTKDITQSRNKRIGIKIVPVSTDCNEQSIDWNTILPHDNNNDNTYMPTPTPIPPVNGSSMNRSTPIELSLADSPISQLPRASRNARTLPPIHHQHTNSLPVRNLRWSNRVTLVTDVTYRIVSKSTINSTLSTNSLSNTRVGAIKRKSNSIQLNSSIVG